MIPDIVEQMENAAEAAYYRIMVDADHFKCGCGNIEKWEDGQPISSNPYAMPVCGKCFSEFIGAINKEI